MKKVLLLVVVGLGVVSASCEKEYTCDCTSTVTVEDFFGGGEPVTTTSNSSTTFTAKKKDAEDTCNQGNTSTSFFGTSSETKCELN